MAGGYAHDIGDTAGLYFPIVTVAVLLVADGAANYNGCMTPHIPPTFTNAAVVLPGGMIPRGSVLIRGERIAALGAPDVVVSPEVVDLDGSYLVPGFIDLHVHGGDGADFMDGNPDDFRTVCRAHARHGTTALLATTTVARHEQHLAFLNTCRELRGKSTGGAEILGAHFYGPYFGADARGCHPGAFVRAPVEDEYRQYLSFSDCIVTATIAPELPGAEGFVRACAQAGIRCNAGHSHCTFEQMQQAIGWGIRHVDHLFCAMSDRARLRQTQTYPMRGGLLEATLFFDELTTEVIADGRHLAPELLKLAYKVKGPDRLALVTDCNRALDQPDGDYMFGPRDGGEPIVRRDGVGIMPDGQSLASGVMGMDHMVRTMAAQTGAPLFEVIRMASLTPARIAGCDRERGSIEVGKLADLVVLDRELNVQRVYVRGRRVV
jgi:N-acetylglucosamine-6-phosphate deacetylase